MIFFRPFIRQCSSSSLKGSRTHKFTYFKRHGRKEQKENRKKMKRTNIIIKCEYQKEMMIILRGGGRGGDLCHTVDVFTCTIVQ